MNINIVLLLKILVEYLLILINKTLFQRLLQFTYYYLFNACNNNIIMVSFDFFSNHIRIVTC